MKKTDGNRVVHSLQLKLFAPRLDLNHLKVPSPVCLRQPDEWQLTNLLDSKLHP